MKDSPQRPHRVVGVLLALGSVLLLIALSVFSPRPLPLEKTLLALAKYDTAFIRDGVPQPFEAALRHALRLDVLMLAGLASLGAGLYAFRARIFRPGSRDRLFSIAITAGCSASIFVALARFGHEASFCPIETLMTNPGSLPVYGQRLLLVWFADAIKLFVPSLSYRVCYLATQLVATWAATYMVGQWTSVFVGNGLKFLGQVLFAVMIIPTINYYTFYDIAIVFFYCCCLLLLYRKRYAAFILVLAIGTLNYENTLLLVGVAVFALYGVTTRRIWIGVPLAALAAWGIVRLSVQWLVPMESHFDPRVWNNFLDLAHPSRDIGESIASVAFWWVCAGIGFRRADRFIRRATILFPGLFAATFVAGKFREARQFDALIPVAIGLILACFNARREPSPSGPSGSLR